MIDTELMQVLADYLERIGESKSPNVFLQSLPEEAKDQLLTLLSQKVKIRDGKALSRWSFVNSYHRNHKLETLSWYQRAYLRQIYGDEAKEIAVRKAVQVGVSEWAICDLLYMTMELGWSGAYIITKTKLRDGFVAERIDKILSPIKYYKAKVGTVDNLGIKALGNGVARFLGSNAKDDFVSFPADFVIIDELDLCDQENLKLVPDRLQASQHKYQRWIGNPTIEDFGIDAKFKESDQKWWQVWCVKCKQYYVLDFFEHVIEESIFGLKIRDKQYNDNPNQNYIHPICSECGSRFDRLGKGKWHAHNQSKLSGYTLSQIYSPTVTLEEMIVDYKEAKDNQSKLQIFYNNKLGLPFNKAGVKITPEMLYQCEQHYTTSFDYSGSNDVIAGVDVGSYLHVVIREILSEENRRLLFANTVASFEDLKDLINRFNIAVMVIDAEPEQRAAKQFQQDHNDIVWLADYHIHDTNAQDVLINKDKKFIRAKRTPSLDGILQDILTQRFILPPNSATMCDKQYYKHLCSSTRLAQEDRFVWLNHGADHFLHAENYCRLGGQVLMGPGVALISMENENNLNKMSSDEIMIKLQNSLTESIWALLNS